MASGRNIFTLEFYISNTFLLAQRGLKTIILSLVQIMENNYSKKFSESICNLIIAWNMLDQHPLGYNYLFPHEMYIKFNVFDMRMND